MESIKSYQLCSENADFVDFGLKLFVGALSTTCGKILLLSSRMIDTQPPKETTLENKISLTLKLKKYKINLQTPYILYTKYSLNAAE